LCSAITTHNTNLLDRVLAVLAQRLFVDESATLKHFQRRFANSGLEVRFYPDSLTSWRWQIGMNGDGEHFELIAWAATAVGLLDAISAKAVAEGRNGHE